MAFIDYDTFKANIDAVVARIAAACRTAGRDPRTVQLVAVTKTQPPAAVAYAARYGLAALGENRVQEAVAKQAECSAAIRWELIGHLQSNKAGPAAAHFARVQSVDRISLLDPLERAAAASGKKLAILLQLNAGNDPAKFGADPADAPALLEAALNRPHLAIEGLMTIAPLSDDPAVAHRTFANLRGLREKLAAHAGRPLSELSMGMSGDLEAAVREGSTLVRIGSALFGPRT